MGGAPDGAVRTGRTRLKCLRLCAPRRGRPGCGIRSGAQASIPQHRTSHGPPAHRSKSRFRSPPKKARGEERPNNRSEAFQAAQSLTHSRRSLLPDEAAEKRKAVALTPSTATARSSYVGARSVRAVEMGRGPSNKWAAGVSPGLGVQKQAQEAIQVLGSSPEYCDGAIEPILSGDDLKEEEEEEEEEEEGGILNSNRRRSYLFA